MIGPTPHGTVRTVRFLGCRRLCALSVALLVTGGACTPDSNVTLDSLGDSPAGFFNASALDGVKPRVSANDAPFRPGRQYFFRDANGELELSMFHDTGELEPLEADRTMAGRDVAFTDRRDDPNQTSSVTLDLDDGTRIFLSSLTLTVERLVVIAIAVEISADGDVSDLDGFTFAGSILQQPLRDGYTTSYELDDGASLSVAVYTMYDDEALSWEFAATDPVTVLDDTDAFMTRPGPRSLNVAFQYPGTDYYVRVLEFSTNTEQIDFVFGYVDVVDLIESIELRAPTPEDLVRD